MNANKKVTYLENKLKEEINMQHFTIFGRQSCGYCHRAKELLERKQYDFNWVDIEKEGITKADLEKTVGKPVLTVPQIFHGEIHIGGYTELNEWVKKQEATAHETTFDSQKVA